MNTSAVPHRSVVALAFHGLLNPIPYGCFVAALINDIVYARSGEVLWEKAAAWLLVIGLLAAIIPRLINLAQVWITSRTLATRTDRIDFWLNLVAIVLAIFNAFVHSRDAYAIAPTSVWLSIGTVALLAIGQIMVAVQRPATEARP